MRWTPKEWLSDVEARFCRPAGDRCVAAPEIDVSHVLAFLCGPRFGARPGFSAFDEVFAAVNGCLPCHHGYGPRSSRFTTPRLRSVVAGHCRGVGDFDREVLL